MCIEQHRCTSCTVLLSHAHRMVCVGYAVWPLRPRCLVPMVHPLDGWLCVFGDREIVRRGLHLLGDVRVLT